MLFPFFIIIIIFEDYFLPFLYLNFIIDSPSMAMLCVMVALFFALYFFLVLYLYFSFDYFYV